MYRNAAHVTVGQHACGADYLAFADLRQHVHTFVVPAVEIQGFGYTLLDAEYRIAHGADHGTVALPVGQRDLQVLRGIHGVFKKLR